MSADAEQEWRSEADEVLDRLQRWYQVPVLAVILGVMLWIRTRAYDNFVHSDAVQFSGNDPYYHYRATMYSVENWPRQLYGDAWTHFPYGGNVGNFGSLMDQTVATVALVVGLGDPSARQVAIVAVLAPAVIATLCALLLYFLGKRLTGHRLGGITAAAVLALVPQPAWVARSTVGFYDHHVAEAFMMAAAVLAMVHALVTVRRERPVYEQVLDRDWDGLRPSVRASAIAGLVTGLYLHVWAPGIVIAGIFGVFFLIAISLFVIRGESPEHLAFAGIISTTIAALTVLPWALSFEFSNAQISLLQVVLLFGVAVGCATMGALSRYWDREQVDPLIYPAAVGAIVVAGFAVLWLVLPEAFASLEGGLSRVVPIGQTETTLTVSEAQPTGWNNFGEKFYEWYGFTFFTAIGGLLVMGARAFLADRPRSEYLLVVVWSLFVFSMAMAQTRFHYYLVLSVAVLNGYLLVEVVRVAAFPSLTAIDEIEAYHVMTVLAIVMLLIVPIAGPIAATSVSDQAGDTRPGSVVLWQDNLDWMEENTPEPGTYGGADNGMSYYGPYDAIDDYEYEEGAYGVMSWWDYGHWITAEGERIPNANPFQEGPRTASSYFQETNETRANLMLEALPSEGVSGSQLDDMTNEELREAIASQSEQEAGEDTRYVMIDDQMVGNKFFAMTQWAGDNYSDYHERQRYQLGEQNQSLRTPSQTFQQTMLSQLYNDDASGLSHYRLVKEVDSYSIVGGAANSQGIGPHRTLRTQLSWNNQTRQIATRLQQANLFGQALQLGQGAYAYGASVESAVKTYERVEGATITGDAEANESVIATVPIETSTGRTFTYSQQTTAGADGSFSVTVPYPTNDELGPDEGYTDAAAEANGTYTVRAGGFQNASAEATDVTVPETAIYEGDEVGVTLEEIENGNGNDTGTGNDSTGGNASGSLPTTDDGSSTGSSDATASSSGAPVASGSSGQSVATTAATAATADVATAAVTGLSSSLAAGVRSLVEPITAPIGG